MGIVGVDSLFRARSMQSHFISWHSGRAWRLVLGSGQHFQSSFRAGVGNLKRLLILLCLWQVLRQVGFGDWIFAAACMLDQHYAARCCGHCCSMIPQNSAFKFRVLCTEESLWRSSLRASRHMGLAPFPEWSSVAPTNFIH